MKTALVNIPVLINMGWAPSFTFNPHGNPGRSTVVIPIWNTCPESPSEWEAEAGFEPRQVASRTQAYNHYARFSPVHFRSMLRKYNDS